MSTKVDSIDSKSRYALEKQISRIDKLRGNLDEVSAEGGRLRERMAASERQIGKLRYPAAPSCFVFFGHHKCGSRFFRTEIFAQLAEMTGARVRQYRIDNPPFHYNHGEDLDLSNMDFSGLGKDGIDVVLFSNATLRSLETIISAAADWRGVRVIRDPRQVLVSDYFHHRDEHASEGRQGWVWDKLARDKEILQTMPEEEGLLYELDSISKDVIEDEVLADFSDERVLNLKLEEFSRDTLIRISEFLEVPDLAGIDLTRTRTNSGSGHWRKHFTPRLTAEFKKRYGQALIALGYEASLDW